MTLFGDPDLARLAVTKADVPTTFYRTPERQLHPKEGSRAERVMQRQEKTDRRKRRAAQNGTGENAGRSKEGRPAGAGQSGQGTGGFIRRLWDRLTRK